MQKSTDACTRCSSWKIGCRLELPDVSGSASAKSDATPRAWHAPCADAAPGAATGDLHVKRIDGGVFAGKLRRRVKIRMVGRSRAGRWRIARPGSRRPGTSRHVFEALVRARVGVLPEYRALFVQKSSKRSGTRCTIVLNSGFARPQACQK